MKKQAAKAESCVGTGQCMGGTCSDCYEYVLTREYELGRIVQLEQLSGGFRKRAGEAFAAGRDSEAMFYRRLAEEYEKQAKDERGRWTGTYHPLRCKGVGSDGTVA